MSRPRSLTRELLAAVLSAAVSLAGAIQLIGHPARTVHVLTVFAGGFGAGAALSRVLDRIRAGRGSAAPL